MKLKITISVDEGLRNEVAELASVEQRNFSQMWGVLAREALDFRSLREPVAAFSHISAPPVSPRLAHEQVQALVADSPAADVPSKPVSNRTVRLTTCEHRNPPGTFCKWGCDG